MNETTARSQLLHIEDVKVPYFYTDHVHCQLNFDHYVNLSDAEYHALFDGGCIEIPASRVRPLPVD